MTEAGLRAAVVKWGRSMFERGLTSGSSGNLSVRSTGGCLVTPTNACLGFLDEKQLSLINTAGTHLSGDEPTKELPLHLAFYQARPSTGAVVHLHSTYATLLSCLEGVDPADAIPPITPYVVMRLGRVPVLPYVRPGDPAIGPLLTAYAAGCAAVLLGNHGPVVSAPTLEAAVFAMEELEEAAKLLILAGNRAIRKLPPDEIATLRDVFGSV